jgi:hypothetical protein
MQQQQILNNDDKFDNFLNKIANLEEESMKLRMKFVGVVFSIGGIIVCLMVNYMVLNFKCIEIILCLLNLFVFEFK